MTEQARTDENGNAIRNCMLTSIPEGEFAALRPALHYVTMGVGDNLHKPEDGIR